MNCLNSTSLHKYGPQSRRRLALAVCLALGVLSGSALGQNSIISMEPPLERAQQLLQSGSYLAAIETFARVDGFDKEQGLLGLSRAYAAMGAYEEAVEAIEREIGAYADSPALST